MYNLFYGLDGPVPGNCQSLCLMLAGHCLMLLTCILKLPPTKNLRAMIASVLFCGGIDEV